LLVLFYFLIIIFKSYKSIPKFNHLKIVKVTNELRLLRRKLSLLELLKIKKRGQLKNGIRKTLAIDLPCLVRKIVSQILEGQKQSDII
jgi:hypothetical protein